MLSRVTSEIHKIYADFDGFWRSEACLLTRQYLGEISSPDDPPPAHTLGEFVILYTPIKLNPPIMLIGNNPSWFHSSDKQKALANLNDVAGHVPGVNSYRKHNHKFAEQMVRIFDKKLRRPDLLDNCVGLNRLWIQTGSGGTGGLFGDQRRTEKGRIESKCHEGTLRIIKLIKPRTVALLGKPAQAAVGIEVQTQLSDITFCDCRHPSRGGERKMEEQLRKLISETGI